jgi:D-glycero-alpha-D-manno-heptose-7-phosphate kinase
MIITQTPYRISMFGGGSDHPVWFTQHVGSVVSFAINKYCYISLRELPPFFKHDYRVVYSKVETVNRVDEIIHPAVREAFKRYGDGFKFELQHHGDLPAQSGVGSSSAFAVGLIHAIRELKNESVSSKKLADEAIFFEQTILKETVGSQDQIACALGGINHLKFHKESWESFSLDVSEDYLKNFENNIILVYSGISRISSDVSKSLIDNLHLKENLMNRNVQMAIDYAEVIKNKGDLACTGELLRESWEIKKKLNPYAVTTQLDEFYNFGLACGADGGKILGAGGGGFFLFWVPPDKQPNFNYKMNNFIKVPVQISKTGSRRII